MLGLLGVLWRRSEGAAAIEFALVCIPLLLITIGIMEFAFALFQWNAAEKATQMGVRQAVVSTPVVSDVSVVNRLNTFDGTAGGKDPGAEPPADFVVAGKARIVCTGDGTSGNCTNVLASIDDSYNKDAHTRIVNRMRLIFPRIAAENVSVEYLFMELGFAGRPCGPVPSVTVRLQNMNFDFIVIDSLLTLVAGGSGLGPSMAMPSFTATMTGEDLKSQGTGCL
ncbi:MAG: TadE/TadG family type IV pilus assembly protein [Alphaproteobacteria bacterium]|nr:TadE/TadG family type IV pilus assembly protein [Alphaproteobacteria bacterium]